MTGVQTCALPILSNHGEYAGLSVAIVNTPLVTVPVKTALAGVRLIPTKPTNTAPVRIAIFFFIFQALSLRGLNFNEIEEQNLLARNLRLKPYLVLKVTVTVAVTVFLIVVVSYMPISEVIVESGVVTWIGPAFTEVIAPTFPPTALVIASARDLASKVALFKSSGRKIGRAHV